MRAYNSFAVIGAGTLGIPIISALLTKNVSVVLLSRPGSGPKPGLPPAVKVVHVDYTDAAAIAAVFTAHGVEVVLPNMTTTASAAQTAVVDAAHSAGVKLFVPSEYGCPTDGHTEGVHGEKNRIAAQLKSLNIPSVRIYTGFFVEFISWITGYAETGKLTILGKGEAPVAFTSIEDIAEFVAHILTTLPASELEDRIFRIEGERTTFNSAAGLFKAPVEHVDRLTGEDAELKTVLWAVLENGGGSTGWDEVNKVERSGSDAAGSANALWPGHHWRSIKEVHGL
ncbi:hypothetical protein C8R47DRAFT_990901 [Mycena vitilis]|nr:hypothetical protein C8R47DRAFT_990901 [Mycena vitilis]